MVGVCARVVALLLLLAACSRGERARPEASQAELLRGTWRVVSYVQRSSVDSVATYPLGTSPRGYLVYDQSGHVFFQAVSPSVMDSLRRGLASGAPKTSLYGLLQGYNAYFGTYVVDALTRTVTHRIEGEVPVRGGSFEVSTVFRVSGDSLVLGRDSAQAWHFVRAK